jgi:hypothetical protein
MARRKRAVDLSVLESLPPEPLQLPSLDRRVLEGPAYRYTITLPLFSAEGSDVFSKIRHVGPLIQVYSRIEAGGMQNPADMFFGYLKSILKKAAFSEQEEILIERAHIELIPSVAVPKVDS